MSKVRIFGPRRELEPVLEELHKLELVQLCEAHEEPFEVSELPENARRRARADELRYLVAELDALLELVAPESHRAQPLRVDLVPGTVDAEAIRRDLAEVAPRVESLRAEIEVLEDEAVVLPRYVEPLEQLLPLLPELAHLEERELQTLRLDTVALVLNTDDDSLIEALRRELAEAVGPQFELVHKKVEAGVTGCVIVFRHDAAAAVRESLGKEHVRHVALPERYGRLSLAGTVAAMRARIEALPREVSAARGALEDLLRPHEAQWRTLLAGLRAELEQLEAAGLAGGTRRTFVVACWVPRKDAPRLREELERRVGEAVVVEESPPDRHDARMPVLLRNRTVARPFESIVRFLDLPRPGTLDPTGLTALFLPIIFGAMVGDVIYGLLLLGAAIWAKRRFREPGMLRDLSSVLLVGSVWSVVFGFVFGEALGNLGKDLLGFDWALWFYRPDELVPLLVFTLALGATHVVLGLGLGIWQGWQERHRGEVLERLGTLLAIAGVFGLAGLAVGRLPGGVITPAVAAIIVGLVLMAASHGRMGILLGPLELIGVIGNVLSYLRIAAVGLASAYLAIVANEFATLGPIWLGVTIAAFFHALNLALAGFSPTIQAMRLHYVEFFSKFYAGGGRAFRPFGARLAERATAERPLDYETLAP